MSSPSINIIERDNSVFVPADIGVGVAVIGYASKGAFDKVTLVRSPSEFDDIFGTQTESSLGYYTVREIFKVTNRLYFVRTGNQNSANVARLSLNFEEQATVEPFLTKQNAKVTFNFLRDRKNSGGFDNNTIEFKDSSVSNAENVLLNITLTNDMTGTQIVQAFVNAFNSLSANLKRGFTLDQVFEPIRRQLSVDFTGKSTTSAGDIDLIIDDQNFTIAVANGLDDVAIAQAVVNHFNTNNKWEVTRTDAKVYFVTKQGNAFVTTGTNEITSTAGGLTGLSFVVENEGRNGSITFVSSKSGSGHTINVLSTFGAENIVSVITPGNQNSFPGQVINFEAREEGTYYKNLKIVRESTVNQFNNTVTHNIYVYLYGTLKEKFKDVSYDENNERYFINLINRTPSNGGSRLIRVNTNTTTRGTSNSWAWAKNADLIVEYTFPTGASSINSNVTNGIPTTDVEKTNSFIRTIQNSGIDNIEGSDFHIVIAPEAYNLEPVKNELIALCEKRKDCITIIDTPHPSIVSTPTEVRDYHNGVGGYNNRNTSFNTSYAAIYSTWGINYNQFSGKNEEIPASVFTTTLILRNVINSGFHLASAGDTRGRLNLAGIVYSPSKAERDQIYGGLNAVNPIVDFASKGITVFGQKTLLRENSALNRINNRMLINEIKKKIKLRLDSLLFDPTSPDSWKKAEKSVISILEPLRASGALENYSIIIDSTINTPEVIRENKIKGIIKVVPFNTIESIEIDLNIEQSGTNLNEK